MLKECFSYHNCSCCTKTAMCSTYQFNKNKLSNVKNIFEIKISNPGIGLFNGKI